jgi:hypothetical protein
LKLHLPLVEAVEVGGAALFAVFAKGASLLSPYRSGSIVPRQFLKAESTSRAPFAKKRKECGTLNFNCKDQSKSLRG